MSQWEKTIDAISKKEIILEENMKTHYSIIWGKVSYVLWHRIQSLDNFKTMESEADAQVLLTALRNQAFNHRNTKPRHYRRLYVILPH